MIDVETLRKLLRYEPETGKLYWLPRPREMFKTLRGFRTWEARFANRPAFTAKRQNGYLVGNIDYQTHRAHRVIWALQFGEWPKDDIDHINGVRDDNRLSNLREATRSQNMTNCKPHKGSTSRFLGVSWNAAERKWVVGISVNGKRKSVGRFTNEIEAARAYNAAASKQYGQFARLNPV